MLGESVSCAGICLTVDKIIKGGFEADVSAETLRATNLRDRANRPINLERATKAGGRLGGHMVLGHVDGVATVKSVTSVGDAWSVAFTMERELAPFVAAKGSITLDGVSLTLNIVEDHTSSVLAPVMLVPYTQGRTTLNELTPGAILNVEVDVLARYVARQLSLAKEDSAPRDQALLEKLRGGGYM